jgi:hypothetical protein
VEGIGRGWSETPPATTSSPQARALPPPIAPPPALLLPNRCRHQPPAEAKVPLDPFPLLLLHRSAVSFVTGGSRHDRGCPGCCASVAWQVGLGPPLSAATASISPGVKRSAFIFCNFRICVNLVKCIEYYLFIRKLCIIYQNVQKNELYLFMSESCMFRQL